MLLPFSLSALFASFERSSLSYLEENRNHPYLEIMLHFFPPQSYTIHWRGGSKAPLTNETTTALFKDAFPNLAAIVASANAKRKIIDTIWRSHETLKLGTSGTAMTVREAIKKNLMGTEDFIIMLIAMGFKTELARMAGITVAELEHTFS